MSEGGERVKGTEGRGIDGEREKLKGRDGKGREGESKRRREIHIHAHVRATYITCTEHGHTSRLQWTGCQ